MNLATRLIVVLCILITGFFTSQSKASDSATRLQSSVHRMAFWLGTGEKASQWRSYLLLNHLDTQAALGDRASVAELQQILERFNRDVNGLDHPAFVEVKEGLKRHINFLATRQEMDFKSTLESATYQPIQRATVEKYRDLAIFEYRVLVNYCLLYTSPSPRDS